MSYHSYRNWATPHNSKCRYGERGMPAAKQKAQAILCVLPSIFATQIACRSRRSGALELCGVTPYCFIAIFLYRGRIMPCSTCGSPPLTVSSSMVTLVMVASEGMSYMIGISRSSTTLRRPRALHRQKGHLCLAELGARPLQ